MTWAISNNSYSRGICALDNIRKRFILINFDTITAIKIAFLTTMTNWFDFRLLGFVIGYQSPLPMDL